MKHVLAIILAVSLCLPADARFFHPENEQGTKSLYYYWDDYLMSACIANWAMFWENEVGKAIPNLPQQERYELRAIFTASCKKEFKNRFNREAPAMPWELDAK